jgi:hypothetical protein
MFENKLNDKTGKITCMTGDFNIDLLKSDDCDYSNRFCDYIYKSGQDLQVQQVRKRQILDFQHKSHIFNVSNKFRLHVMQSEETGLFGIL